MNWLKQLPRLRCSLLAAIAGWLAGMLMTLPMEASVAWRNTDGELALMAETLLLGIVIWGTLTLFFSLIVWLLLAVPLVLILPPWLLRAHKGALMAALSAAAISIPGKTFGLFTLLRTVKMFDKHNFFVYSIFGVSYAVVSLLVYLRLEGGLGAASTTAGKATAMTGSTRSR